MPLTMKCLAAIPVLAVLAGCAAEPALEIPETYPVTGKVVSTRAAGISNAFLDLRPVNGESTLIISCSTNADGDFDLMTRHINDRKDQHRKRGVPAGEYRLTIMPPPSQDQQSHMPPIAWPSPITVKPESNTFTFDLSKARTR